MTEESGLPKTNTKTPMPKVKPPNIKKGDRITITGSHHNDGIFIAVRDLPLSSEMVIVKMLKSRGFVAWLRRLFRMGGYHAVQDDSRSHNRIKCTAESHAETAWIDVKFAKSTKGERCE